MAGANFERSGSGSVAAGQRDLDELIKFCGETQRDGQTLSKNILVRHKLAEMTIELEAARQLAYYCAWQQTKNPMTVGEPSASKWYQSELMVRLANTGIEIMGLYGTLRQGTKWAPLLGKFQSQCIFNLGVTIAAGSTEIQKNVIAWVVLGLPRK
jgi:alkylation response protein AidB-like acyl-CoA dehydrogenase